MAGFNLSATETTIRITGITFDTSYAYMRIYCRQGSTVIEDTFVSAGSSYTITGLSPGTTYTVNVGGNDTGSGGVTWIGAQSITTQGTPAFAWTYPKTTGGSFNLTKSEWDSLWSFIETRTGSAVSHTSAAVGGRFTAAMYNEAVNAIGAGTLVSAGEPITAALMNELVTNVNNM